MLDSIGVDQPEWSALTSIPEALAFADRVSHFAYAYSYSATRITATFTFAVMVLYQL
jgi:hypothetical protein